MKSARLLIIFLLFSQVSAQTKADLQILAEVANIKAIDNHSHVERVTNENETVNEGDAISCGGLQFVSPNDLARKCQRIMRIRIEKMNGTKPRHRS